MFLNLAIPSSRNVLYVIIKQVLEVSSQIVEIQEGQLFSGGSSGSDCLGLGFISSFQIGVLIVQDETPDLSSSVNKNVLHLVSIQAAWSWESSW